MPASETSATVVPPSSFAINSGLRCLVVLVITDRRLGDSVTIQQLARMPRVLASDQVRFFQNAHRAKGDVFQISDGRAHQVERTAQRFSSGKPVRALTTGMLSMRSAGGRRTGIGSRFFGTGTSRSGMEQTIASPKL
jgi:hypothetical protein